MRMTHRTIIAHIVGRLEGIVPMKPGLRMAGFANTILVAVVIFVIIGKGVEGGAPGVGAAALKNNVTLPAVGRVDHGVG